MGKRKERRIAAIAAGRRVKLDLFAEPPGDVGSSSAKEEVGGAGDAQNRAGLPSSPSSSGKLPENPLVLLGQYSDDELDDGSSGEEKRAVPEDSLVLSDDSQGKVADRRGNEDCLIEETNGASVKEAGVIQTEDGTFFLDSTLKLETGGTAADVLDNNCSTEITPAASTSDIEVGDGNSGWKIVWHEESNQYYYWNISTGETSWTVPEVLQAGVGSETANTGEKEKAVDVADVSNTNFEKTEASERIIRAETLGGDASKDHKIYPDAHQNHQENFPSLATVENHVTFPGNSDGVHIGVKSAKSFASPKLGDGESNECGTLSSSLIEQCEHLLEQLNSVKGSHYLLHGHVELRTLIFEVEMRLADMKSLACYKSSLLPFWQLSENRLHQLGIKITDFLRELKSEKENEVASTDSLTANSCREVDASSCEEKFVSASGNLHTLEPSGIVADLQNNHETQNHKPTGDENVPSERYLNEYTVSGATEEDMDVDMEVDDATPSTNIGTSVTSAQLNLPTSTMADPGISALGKVNSVPPPPVEDWIPPPPPDDEPFPPPPPDEPPEIPYSQLSDVASVPSFPYMEQYNVYPSSHFQHAAQISSDVASANLYAPADGRQPAVSQLPLYYDTVPDAYNTATLGVIPTETGLYYGFQGSVTQPLVPNSISGSHGTLDTHGDLGYTLLPKDGNPQQGSLENSSSEAPLQSSSITSLTESASVSSIPTSTANISTSVTAPKAQSKVSRNKKRTVAVVSSLRSNKKVSSLVDKWKAAKEELKEQEKEPENALEILERKRQREVEEWRKQQIASGEAKDNANFQPLGGDWRERVKRKRAQLAQESAQSPSDGVSEVNNSQPDLGELSRGLPQGWQAFWDESSKQVYYGNTSTSETSWIRPAD